MTVDEKLARLRTSRNNIARYKRLLRTQLTEHERGYIERRLAEELEMAEQLMSETFPLEIGAKARTTGNLNLSS